MNNSISIVTINYNDLQNLKKTVINISMLKAFFEIEFIVIDGGSSDGSLDYIKNNSECIDVYLSEPDEGIGNAWNKGISLCSNNIIGILNSGDIYTYELIGKVISELKNKKNTISYSNTIKEVNGHIDAVNNGDLNKYSIYSGFGFYHPSCFVTKDVYEKIGKFNESLKIAIDTDWLIRAIKHGVNFIHIPGIVIMDGSGISSQNRKQGHWEYLSRLEYFGYSKFLILISKIRFYLFNFINFLRSER